MTRAVPVALALLLSAATAPAHAGGFGVPEHGVRRTAMAATIGRPDEPSAVFHNPAGLALQHGTRVYASFGLSKLATHFQVRPWDRSEEYLDHPVDADGYYPTTRPTRAAAVIPMVVATHELVPDRWFVALGVFVSNATGARFERDAVTRYHLIDGYVVAPTVEASVAYRASPRLAVAASLGVMHVRLHGNRYVFPIVDGADLTRLLGSKPELTVDGSDTVPSWRLGVVATPTPRVTLGAALIGRADPVLSGPLTLRYGDDAVTDPGYVIRGRAHTELLLPWTFHAGAHVDVLPSLEVGAELRYWLYRQYDVQRTRIDNVFLIDRLETRKDYRDSWQVSGGVRVHDVPAAPGVEAMLGLHYDRTPAPPQTVTLDQPTFSHVGLHTGVRLDLGRHRVGASYVHYWYDVPTIEDSITSPPSNIRGDGVNHIVTVSLETALGAFR